MSLGQGITPVHLDGLRCDRDWKPLEQHRFAALQRGDDFTGMRV